MRSKKQKSLNSVKHSLKKDGDFRKYKHLFKNKQVRFLFSKMSIIFESTISSQDLTSVEKSLLDNPTQENFITSLIELSKTFDAKFINLKWDKLGICLWYAFQTSLFYNKKRTIECEYTYDNFVVLNNYKRESFSEWLKSFYDTKNIDFNSYVVKVLEIVT